MASSESVRIQMRHAVPRLLAAARSRPEAAAATGRQAFLSTRRSGGDPNVQREYGAFIFEYGGHTWTAPLTPGSAQGQGGAKVNVVQMHNDMIRFVASAGILPNAIVVGGMLHSHPTQPDLSGVDKMVHSDLANPARRPQLIPSGARWNYRNTYVWGPRNSNLGGFGAPNPAAMRTSVKCAGCSVAGWTASRPCGPSSALKPNRM